MPEGVNTICTPLTSPLTHHITDHDMFGVGLPRASQSSVRLLPATNPAIKVVVVITGTAVGEHS